MKRMPTVHASLAILASLAQEAGDGILTHYTKQRTVLAEKNDGSPLTEADIAAHHIIEAGLRRHYPHIPVISEESADKRLAAGQANFWLVDPLDGTREFLNGNGEFTVNIALIKNGRPALGIVHAPALGRTYLGQRGVGSWRTTARIARRDVSSLADNLTPIYVVAPTASVRVVTSRSHADSRTLALLANIPQYKLVPAGSSLKFCMVAEGSADFYPRLGTTMEWDTAAAQCVLEAAGGKVLSMDGETLEYCKAEWRNPHFLAVGSRMPMYDTLIATVNEGAI